MYNGENVPTNTFNVSRMVLVMRLAPFTQKTEVPGTAHLSFSSSSAISLSYFACSASYSF